jgi:hypothetical protein
VTPSTVLCTVYGAAAGEYAGEKAGEYACSKEETTSNGGTYYQGSGRPRDSDYTAGGNIRHH